MRQKFKKFITKDLHKNNTDNVIFIPVRSGSTRIKNKNLQKINGISLLKKKILNCKKSAIGKIVISSNSDKILNEASKIKNVEIFKRNKKYATSKASTISTILEYLRNLRKKKLPIPKFITITPVTNPFLKYETLRLGYKKIKKNKNLSSVIGITECSEHPFLSVVVGSKLRFNLFKINGKKGSDFERSQDVPKSYIQSASFRISKTTYFLKFISEKSPTFSKPNFNENSCGYIKIKQIENFDINTADDLRLARVVKP